uniref:CycP n=1 Tax=Streptomyces sp. NCIB 11649 TaxID=1756463 RepID=A0A0S2RRE7_9ACTN|nr:CycP [Streptomyces sp. NCIB 11649]
MRAPNFCMSCAMYFRQVRTDRPSLRAIVSSLAPFISIWRISPLRSSLIRTSSPGPGAKSRAPAQERPKEEYRKATTVGSWITATALPSSSVTGMKAMAASKTISWPNDGATVRIRAPAPISASACSRAELSNRAVCWKRSRVGIPGASNGGSHSNSSRIGRPPPGSMATTSSLLSAATSCMRAHAESRSSSSLTPSRAGASSFRGKPPSHRLRR